MQMILILAIIGFCFTQTDPNICTTKFEEIVNEKCKALHDSCAFLNYNKECISKTENDCSEGDNDSTLCNKIFPDDFPKHKCVYNNGNNKCENKPTDCSDYNGINGITFTGNKDLCAQFSSGDNDKICLLNNNGRTCQSHFISCEKATTAVCDSNLLSNYQRKCHLEGTVCTEVERKCDVPLSNVNEEQCHNLNPSVPAKQKCVYNNGVCKEEYINCQDIPSPSTSTCDKKPLISKGSYFDYDYKYECEYISTSGSVNAHCAPKQIYCTDYRGNDASICLQHQAKDSNKRCVYDSTHTPNTCYEEYKTCEDYTNNNIKTDKSGCENIKLLEENEKCIYIPEEDSCVTKSANTFTKCDDYTGNNKKICESIILPQNTNSYCILDKDRTCKERPLLCEEAYNEEDCIHIAKASDPNKRCAYKSSKCYEEYIRCEDFLENSNSGSTSCPSIRLYDGKTCDSSSTTRCRSNYKTCGQANSEEECKLIAKTGVSDQERKVCGYDKTLSRPCFETYKYCSDYRKICSSGDNTCKTFCENQIKPYDDSGENIDIRYKCKYEDDVGCQRVPVECSDAKTNPILCESFNEYIKDKDKMHCVFYGGNCKSQYRKCEDVENNADCQNNIIEGYIIGACDVEGIKCKAKKDCSLFIPPSSFLSSSPTHSSQYYQTICESINPNCTYMESGECEFKKKSCDKTIFYSVDEEKNKEICENIEASKPYKKCILKEDKSGCEEIYREFDYSNAYISYKNTSDNANQGSSSWLNTNKIILIIAILYLLI